MKSYTHVVVDPLGIHARPAAQIAQACVNFRSSITITCGEHNANGNNVLQILGLHG